jgi:hypothetical protein
MTDLARNEAQLLIEKTFFRFVQGSEKQDWRGASHDPGSSGRTLQTAIARELGAADTRKILGFSITQESPKVTLGDWNPSSALFLGANQKIDRTAFLEIFGATSKAGGHLTWSGSAFPKVGTYSSSGQTIVANTRDGVKILFDQKFDSSLSRKIPWRVLEANPNEVLTLAHWSRERLTELLSDKYQPFGWAHLCSKKGSHRIDSIRFGRPVEFKDLILGLNNGALIIDSGMTSKSGRNRLLWRSTKKFWDEISDES